MLSEFWSLKGWIAFVPLLIGAVALYAWIGIGDQARQMERNGIEAQATIVDLRTVSRPVATQIGGATTARLSTNYYATVMFGTGTALDGTLTIQQVEHFVDRAYYEAASIGDRVWVRYLPDDPQKIELVRGGTQTNSNAAGYVALGLLILGGLIAWPISLQASRIHQFKTLGIEVQGTITAIADQTGVTLLSLTLPDGRAVKSLPIKGKGLPFVIGQTVTVLSIPAIAHQVMVPPAR